MSELILLNKPFRVLSQFTDTQGRATLADYVSDRNVYPAGRLDYDSEGLVLLCSDGALQQRITDPATKMWKRYLLQLEGDIDEGARQMLCDGIELKDGMTRPARVSRVEAPALWSRNPPIRERRDQSTSWIEIEISEGRNRQLRRMAAAVGFPVLRLIRTAIGDWQLKNMKPGELRRETVNLPKVPKAQKASRRQGPGAGSNSPKRPGGGSGSGRIRRRS
ncbi:MAG: pseudouridine synthase [Pseudomonadota bacterium]